MELPEALRTAMEQRLLDYGQAELTRDAQRISLKYRSRENRGERLLTKAGEALAYAAARMPATYGAVRSALASALSSSGCRPITLLDLGAGTGAAAWAADSLLELDGIICLEREEAMLSLGKSLMMGGSDILQKAQWIQYDLSAGLRTYKAELVTAAYVLNEMPEKARLDAVSQLYQAAGKMLLLVEPGTPEGYENISRARKLLLSEGTHIAAPCTHEHSCALNAGDWCHFTCRISRSRLQKRLKGGEAPYEDEKFSYLAAVRVPVGHSVARVLRHPLIRKGFVSLEVCTDYGVQRISVSKKDGDLYKMARKVGAGDEIGMNF